MEINLRFTFRNKESEATVIIDCTEALCFLFVFLKDEKLKKEFGNEISIPNNLEKVLIRPGCHPKPLDKLNMAILEAIKNTEHFEKIKQLYHPLKKTA